MSRSTQRLDDVRELGRSFARSMRAENLSPNTIESYGESLKQLADFLESESLPTAVSEVRKVHIDGFLEHLLNTRTPATANNRFRGIQQFWKWCVDEGEIEVSPMATSKPPKVPEQLVPVIPEEDLEKLFRACSGQTFNDRRDHALMRVFASTGARKAEIANLKYHPTDPERSDIDLDSRWGATAELHGKGGSARLVRLSPKTVRAVDRYLRIRRNHVDADSVWLWLGKRGRLLPNGCARVLKKRAVMAGLGNLHLHQIRHSYAHAFLSDGGSETDLMRSMGWMSREMVGRYAKSAGQERALKASDRVGFASRL